VLVTLLFTDLVGSTERAASLGDRAWKTLLRRHHDAVRQELARHRGREVDTAGDGFFATFDGPARAIRCATAIREQLTMLDLPVRAGIHTGECEVVDDKPMGIAVHIAARVASVGSDGDILVTSAVKDLVAGSGIDFDDTGEHEFKGVPGSWKVHAVITAPGAYPATTRLRVDQHGA
jgi:class 3 adenylate cyclase